MLIFEKNSIFNFSNPTFYNLILPYKTQILTYLARRFNKRDRTLLYEHVLFLGVFSGFRGCYVW